MVTYTADTSKAFDRIYFLKSLNLSVCIQESQNTTYSEKLPIPANSETPSWVAHYIVVVVNRDIRTENQDTPAPI